MEWIHHLNYVIEHSASAWWVVPLITLFCLIDGFFLFLPSETAIVALANASITFAHGQPNLWYLWAGGAVGAIIGDNIAYQMGKRLGTSRFAWMRKPKAAKAFEWARKELDKRGAVLIFTARYIPVGRVAVNFTAGATKYPWRQFAILDAFAAMTWSGYGIAIGVLAGQFKFLHGNPLLSILIAIVFAIIMGIAVDHLIKLAHRAGDRRKESKTQVQVKK